MPESHSESKPKLHSYWTGLKTISSAPKEIAAVRSVYRGRGWQIRFVPDRDRLPGAPKRLRRKLARTGMKSWELQIRAASLEAAFYVADLLYAARSIIEAPPVERLIGGWEPFIPVPEDKMEMMSLAPDVQSELAHRRSSFHMNTSGLPDAAKVACSLARRVRLRNAAFKFLLSSYLFSVHYMDLRPGGSLRLRIPGDASRSRDLVCASPLCSIRRSRRVACRTECYFCTPKSAARWKLEPARSSGPGRAPEANRDRRH